MSHPLYEVVTGEGLMRPCFKTRTGLYSGESAQMVENSLNIHGDEILYVGDHIYTDVSQFKVHLRWRTALICRELEEEYKALIHSRGPRATVVELINQKEVVGDLFNQLRLALQRRTKGRPAQTLAATNMDDRELTENMQKLLIVMQRLQYSLLLAQLFAQHAMSKVGEEFMAGVLDHLPSILAFTAPLPNSYDRIQPNTWSGAYQCWGKEREAHCIFYYLAMCIVIGKLN
ncbi:cytosolic purine 5'-nucleotidase isoform X2 [Gossypium hirsutum]|nr:cytosolic purine 5'-nucleotidase isoform X2 [Gossypium hirsutum]XP_016734935.1 cytosolic purine 5'-nucleotidase isoform X2 [Gossypium hirsutum]